MNGNANISTELLSAVKAIKTAILQSQARAVQVRSGGQTVTGFGGSDPNALYLPLITDGLYEAYYTTKDKKEKDVEVVAGQLNVVSYTQQSINVCLVGVNGTRYQNSISELAAYLNKVFGQAVFGVNLTTASIDVDKFNGTLSAKESGALSAYNSDMKKLIRKVKKLPDYTDDTYYIMLVAKSDNPALGGFMPVNSNFGFVFAQANSGAEQMNRTIAHELAHGAFRLWHTFSSENIYVAQRGSTQNLMDYNGTNAELYKYQWDYIHNPQGDIVRWMVDESESEVRELTSIKWIGDWLEGYFYDEIEKSAEADLPIFDRMYGSYNNLMGMAKYEHFTFGLNKYYTIICSSPTYLVDNTRVENNKYYDKNQKLKKIFDNFSNGENIDFKGVFLSDRNIYFEEYNLENIEYKLALYVGNELSLSNEMYVVNSFSELSDSKNVKVGYTSKYGLIVLFKQNAPYLTIQIMGGEPKESAIKWANYLSLICKSEEESNVDKDILGDIQIHDKDKLAEIWGQYFKTDNFIELMQKEVLTPAEIKECRKYIKTLSDEGEKAKWYLKLQEKVPYHNQRDNESPTLPDDYTNNKWMKDNNITTAGDIMCNLTAEAMCLEMLGIEFPCLDCNSDCDKYRQFEDYLECLRVINVYEHRTKNDARTNLAKLFNVKCDIVEDINSNDRNTIESKTSKSGQKLGDALKEGKSVLISVNFGGGHIVRLQTITDEGLIVDDPYGKVYDFSKSGCTPKYRIDGKYDQRNNGNDGKNDSNLGDNNKWTWSDLITNKIVIKYAEIYSTND